MDLPVLETEGDKTPMERVSLQMDSVEAKLKDSSQEILQVIEIWEANSIYSVLLPQFV